MSARFRFVLSDGSIVVGAVQGAGGFIAERGGLRRLVGCQRLVSEGRSLGIIYEPRPGCVSVYPQFSATADGPEVVVPLAGARISLEAA